jgi:hypothetical protein
MGEYRLDLSVSGQRPVAGLWGHSNASLGSIKCWEFFQRLRDFVPLSLSYLMKMLLLNLFVQD